jgi:hypothetical protein
MTMPVASLSKGTRYAGVSFRFVIEISWTGRGGRKIGVHYWPEFLVIKSVDLLENERMLIARTLLAPTPAV